jgi:DNA-directed RNA polymerase subunit RPC12/RpoP
MGMGYEYKCSKCGKEYYVSLGVGFLQPNICKEELKKIKNGEYGED